MSGLVPVTGAAGDGPGSRAAGWPGCWCFDRGAPVRAFVRTQDHRAEQLLQLGAEVVAGDPCEIADVECRRSAGNNRVASTASMFSFLNSDTPLQGSGQGSQRPRNRNCGISASSDKVETPHTARSATAGWRSRRRSGRWPMTGSPPKPSWASASAHRWGCPAHRACSLAAILSRFSLR